MNRARQLRPSAALWLLFAVALAAASAASADSPPPTTSSFSPPSGEVDSTAAIVIACPEGQYSAEYFVDQSGQHLDGSPVTSLCEGAPLAHTYGVGGPDVLSGVTDGFSARWTGTFGFPSDGVYVFTAR